MSFLGLIGNLSSIAGFVISCWVLWQVREIEKQYLRQVRAPALVRRLAEHEQNLSKLLLVPSLDNEEASVTLASSESVLRNLLPKLSGDEKKQTKSVVNKLARARSGTITRTVAIELRADIAGVLEAVREQQKDTPWIR